MNRRAHGRGNFLLHHGLRLAKAFILACGLAATTVSVTGGIFFIGLVVPHMARLIVGPAHRGLLPGIVKSSW